METKKFWRILQKRDSCWGLDCDEDDEEKEEENGDDGDEEEDNGDDDDYEKENDDVGWLFRIRGPKVTMLPSFCLMIMMLIMIRSWW